jgi:hypothetical protein
LQAVGWSVRDTLRETARALRDQKALLTDFGVVLAIELHFEFTTFELLRLFEMCGARPGEYLGVCLDTMNLLTMLEDPVQLLHGQGERRRVLDDHHLPMVLGDPPAPDRILLPGMEGIGPGIGFPVVSRGALPPLDSSGSFGVIAPCGTRDSVA